MTTPVNPLDVPCPHCRAQAGKPCTTPSKRRHIRGSHDSRETAAQQTAN